MACSAPRMVASWAPPTPGPLHLLCLLPGALALGPGLSLPPCPCPSCLQAGRRPVGWRVCSPRGTQSGDSWVWSWAVTRCLGPTSHGEAWFLPRGKAWSWPWGPGEPNSCWWETPVSPHPARSWALSLPAWVGGEAEPALPRGGPRARRAGRAWPRGAGRGEGTDGATGPPSPWEPRRPGCGPRGCSGLPRGPACPLPFLLACSGNERFPPPLLDCFPGGRACGRGGGLGPGVALELPSPPRAVPSPRQAPSHTPTPPVPRGPEARRVGVWICWDAARGSCAPSPAAVQSGCVQSPWGVSAKVSELTAGRPWPWLAPWWPWLCPRVLA